MKKKNKNKKLVFIIFYLLLLTVGFFIFSKGASAEEKDLIISEIMYYYSGHSDWIELYNPTGEKITITKGEFGIIDEKDIEMGSDGVQYKNCHKIDGDLEIGSKEFLIIASDKDNFKFDYPDSKSEVLDSAFSLSSDGDYLKLSDDRCATFFLEMDYKKSWGGTNNGRTLEKKELDENYKEEAWQESYLDGGTPGEKNSEKPEPKIYPTGIYISELLPNPEGSDEENEYIELYNSTKDDINLSGWILEDKSAGKYVFPKNSSIESLNLLVIYRKDFSFAINNSDEVVYLLDPNGKNSSEASFSDSAKEGYSYSFDAESSSWRWTSKKTPGVKNEFDKILVGKVKKDDQVYVGIYASFAVNADSDAQKFTWDFGDGHKSYLKEIRHKYEEVGKYEGSLKIQGNGETSEYFFTVKAEKYSAPKVRIASFSPNPKGSDTKNEYIVLENKSKKKIDLEGWSIATGWDKLANHPIREKFVLKPGKSKKLKHKISAFTLNNAKTKIELRDPSGKVVQKIKYDRTANKIEEDEIYQKGEADWDWLETGKTLNNTEPMLDYGVKNTEDNPTGNDSANSNADTEPAPPAEEIKNQEETATPSPDDNLKDNPEKSSEDLAGQVAGVSAEKNTIPSQKNWAAKLLSSSWIKINFSLNWILNKIF